jgi:SAM-dependent methyltransferase
MTERDANLNSFLNRAIGDLGAAMSAVLVCIGDELGFYRELAKGPLTPHELAARTGTTERCVREWLANQAAGGYVTFEAAFDRYGLDDAQATCLAGGRDTGRADMYDLPGAYHMVEDFFRVKEQALRAYRTGERLPWDEHQPSLFDGAERFLSATYRTHLLEHWLPALDGLVEKLQAGAAAADVGCGLGTSTMLMAEAFPGSKFVGIDTSPTAIEAARRRASEHGLRNVRFVVGDAATYQEGELDFVAFLNSLHSMSDPAACARHSLHQLRQDGHALIVEPRAGDRIEDNLNPIGRMYYATSAMVYVPNALAADGHKIGAQAGERALAEVLVEEGGFTRLRRVFDTPLNMVLEARP